MIATLRRLYRTPEHVPIEVLEFIKALGKDYPQPTPTVTDTLPMIQRVAGRQEFISDGLGYLRKIL